MIFAIEIPDRISPALHRAFLKGWIAAYMGQTKRWRSGYSRLSHVLAWLDGYRGGQARVRLEIAENRRERARR